jgi:predicted Rossmann-fold nucleotide-binding protein
VGELADAILRTDGDVQGATPENLMALEVGHNRLTKLHVVHSMHERKALMAYLSDAFVAMPGITILEGEVARSLDPRFA